MSQDRPRASPLSLAALLFCGLAGAALPSAALPAATPPGAAPPAATPKPGTPAPPEVAPVPVHIAGIKMVGENQVLLLLANEAETRAVPIVVGRDPGLAIYMGRERAATPRPMTHDLLVQLLKTLKASVEKITVTELKNDTYYSEIALRAGGTAHLLDARPSDAIALAVRLDTPIFAAPALLLAPDAPRPPGVTARGPSGTPRIAAARLRP